VSCAVVFDGFTPGPAGATWSGLAAATGWTAGTLGADDEASFFCCLGAFAELPVDES